MSPTKQAKSQGNSGNSVRDQFSSGHRKNREQVKVNKFVI